MKKRTKFVIKTWHIIIAGIFTAMLLLPHFPIVKEIRLRMSLQQISAHPESQDLETMDKMLTVKEQLDGDVTLQDDVNKEIALLISENGWNELKTDMEKVQAINTWVKNNIKYAWDDSCPNWVMRKYGNSTFLSGYGDCCGYSRVTKILLNALGIECHTIRVEYRSDLNEVPVRVLDKIVNCQHAISAVKIDDLWYILDTTNNNKETAKPITPAEYAKCTYAFNACYDYESRSLYYLRYWPTDTVAKALGMPEFTISVPSFN